MGPQMLTAIDYGVLAAYLLGVGWIGLYASRAGADTRDYFLASRSIPWWAAGVSIIATETSALTFIGAPTQSLRGDWTYLQLAIGSVLARFFIASVFIQAYYRTDCTTVYDYLGLRFGPRSKDAGSLLFAVGRLLGSGVRLYGAAIALVIVTDASFPLAIVAIASVALAYTISGGIRSVIWTDMIQGVLLVGGGLLALLFLVFGSDGGPAGLWSTLTAGTTPSGEPKLRVINLSLDPRDAYTLCAGLVGSTFLTLSTHGTDQDMLQRALTPETAAGGKRSLWLSAVLNIPIAILFLAVGSALWASLGGDAGAARLAGEIAAAKGLASPEKGFDFLFPYWVVRELPAGVRGLIIAGIFAASMSSLDSAIAALASTGVKSLWEPYLSARHPEADGVVVSRWMSLGFGILLVAVALVVWASEGAGDSSQGFGVLMLGLKVLSWIFPPLLGVFLVGLLTDRGHDLGNLVALATGVSVLLAVEFSNALFGSPPPFAWAWNAFVGTLMSAGVACCFYTRGRGRV